MSKELNNPGRLDAQAYKADPDNVESPTPNYKAYEKGLNAESLLSTAEIADDLVDLSLRVDVTEAGVADNASGVSANASDISSLASGVSANTNGITTNANGITANANAISIHDTQITNNASGISANASGISTNASGISTNAAGILGLTGDVGDLNDEKLAKSSNLSDLANVSTARTNLDVYSKAESDAATGPTAATITSVTSADGKTFVGEVTTGALSSKKMCPSMTINLKRNSETDVTAHCFFSYDGSFTNLSALVRQTGGTDAVDSVQAAGVSPNQATINLVITLPFDSTKLHITVEQLASTIKVTFFRSDLSDVPLASLTGTCSALFMVY